ncbi:PA14 domain-containing protein [Dyadobacter sp. CY107]|uniref:PA14 domain-containing protein n=1 Tax=Dyadobacter fanqingshengii TaxID=2906443 RepID=UPI001F2741B6|nr:PA14 domain-containing protein [Dyadobacter fanqingshengii]MCF2501855.1 PA14 domain-containing protein [Dyadobacter fanqingshengii]
MMLFQQLSKKLVAAALIFCAPIALAQPGLESLPFDTLSLENLDQFSNANSKNWHITGNVSADRKQIGNLTEIKGKGILVYQPTQESQQLASKLKFGDADIELDFLLSKGASFYVRLYDRYAIKITDDWMKQVNPGAKAPGLWQHLTIHFKAPVLDKNGKETQSARFEKILLNGQKFVNNADQEAVRAPQKTANKSLAFIGKDLPFAIRNIRYKIYQADLIHISTTNFRVYQGLHKNPDTLATLQPKRTGATDTLSHWVGDRKSQLVMDGTMEIPRDGDYLFKMIAGGGAWFFIDEKRVIDNRGTRDFERAFYAKHTLRKGKYPFKVVYSNSDECLVLHYEGPQIPWQSLTTPASVRVSERFEPLEYEVKNKPAMQRGFMMHRNKINPYTASVGIPSLTSGREKSGNNYAYDMKRYNVLAAWHGRFIDVSNMWTERGEKQLEIPLGAKLEFSQKPLLASLPSPEAPWPDSAQTADGVFSARGYKLIGNGLPVYFYTLNETRIEDHLHPAPDNEGLTREIKTASKPGKVAYLLLAEGRVIEQTTQGGYAVDDKNYYIENLQTGSVKPILRRDNGRQQLILPIQNETLTVKYDMIW